MLSGTCRCAHRSSSAWTVPLSPRYSAIRSPANVAANAFPFLTLPDSATGYQKFGLIAILRRSRCWPAGDTAPIVPSSAEIVSVMSSPLRLGHTGSPVYDYHERANPEVPGAALDTTQRK